MDVSHAALWSIPLAAAACFVGGSPRSLGARDAGASSASSGSWQRRVMHRLTRVEYDHTVRDLLGEPQSVASELPEDQTSALGYDNDGVSLVTSAPLVESYFDVAGELAQRLFARLHPYSQAFTIVSEPNFGQPCTGLASDQICGNDAGAWENGDPNTGFWGLRPSFANEPNDLVRDGVAIDVAGTYDLSLDAFATPDTGCATGTCTVKLALAIDTTEKDFDITGAKTPEKLVLAAPLVAGLHTLRVASIQMYDAQNPSSQYDRTAWIGDVRLDAAPSASLSPSAASILDCGGAPAASGACAEHVLATFLPRAWRRPVTDAEIADVVGVADAILKNPAEPGTAEEKWERGVELAIQEALTSPYFVYRPEPAPLDDYGLASRLSYFLWASMPDDELFARAKDATLHEPAVLDAEVDRMLADPKAASLADDFAGQWLETRTFATVTPSASLYPRFDDAIRDAMTEETRAFFLDFLQPNKSFPDMLDAPYTFANGPLAAYYGLSLGGDPREVHPFERVSLAGSHREGLLSLGSILTVTSQPTRTSPVERGKFVLARLFCDSPPPPPANVPPLDVQPTDGSMRQRLEQHVKAGPACSSCHDLLDPIGLALENFDAVGAWRTMDGPYPIDTSGLSYEGKTISDVASLAALVKADPRFVPCVSHQLYAYAMGQEAQSADADATAALDAAAAASGESLRAMIHAIVHSPAFLTRSP